MVKKKIVVELEMQDDIAESWDQLVEVAFEPLIDSGEINSYKYGEKK